MSVATLPSEAAEPTAMEGAAAVAFAARDGFTHLSRLYQRAPLRVLFPRPGPGDVPLAAVATTSGGLVGGDRLTLDIAAEAGARAVVTAQAAEKVYRSLGADVCVEVSLRAEADAWLEWLPQETILFGGSRLRRRTCVEISAGARLLAGEMLVFGRIARGERLSAGLVHDTWDVFRDGRRVWSDAFRLAGDVQRPLAHPAGLAGATAYATAVYAADDAPQRLPDARDALAGATLAGSGTRAAATCVGGVLIARWLGPDAAAVRRSFGSFWAAFRATVGGLPPVLPRLWHV